MLFFGLTHPMKCTFFGLTFSKTLDFRGYILRKRNKFGLTLLFRAYNLLFLLMI
ncbi:hypothetical protein ES703_52797 [subsurface metagenome]